MNAQLAITSWRDVGPRDAPVVVLLHAIATCSELWAAQIPVWSQFARILAVDLPGHGTSAPRPQINSLDQYAHALAELLASAGIEDVSIVGLSFGGMIGQAFALTMSIRLVQIVWNLVAGVFVFRGGYHAPSEKEQQAMESDEGGPASVAQGREPDRAGPIGAQPRLTLDKGSSAGPSVRTELAESGSLPRVNDAAPQSEP